MRERTRQRRQCHGPFIESNRHDACDPAGPAEATRDRAAGSHEAGGRAGVATMGVAGRGLILPWVDFGRAAAAAELVEPEVRASQ